VKKILITSALPYANGPLHFGHIAGAYLPGDCYARFQRLNGSDVLYICGSDEYGVAITLSADLAGRTPQEQVDLYHQVNVDLFKKLDFSFDHFSRTTWEGHKEPVQQYFLDLLENGYIEEKVTDQLYSEEEDRFLADRYVVGTCPACGHEEARGDECTKCGASFDAIELKNPRSKLTGTRLIKRKTKHWFLLLDQFKDRLLEWVDTKEWKPNVTKFIKGYIKGMHPRAITRDSTWGVPIPLPNTEGKVLYVWFDAPIGYISASMEWAQKINDPKRWRSYWCDEETKLVHFIGKDNIPFHGAIFPAMTLGQNQPYKLVDELPANEFLNLEGRQFSKTEGWSIDLESFFEKYTADQIRYTLASNAPETSDSEFTWHDFQNRCNVELLGKYGNLVNRVLVFAAKHCDGAVPPKRKLLEEDHQFLEHIKHLADVAKEAYENFKLRRASHAVMELAQLGNAYFDKKAPWREAKENRASMELTIACCLECLKTLALISSPIIPSSAQNVWEMLGFTNSLEEQAWDRVVEEELKRGQRLRKPVILFRKIEDEEIEKELEELHQMDRGVTKKKEDLMSFETFQQLDLKVGKVLEAEKVEKSEKLLKLIVDIGNEKRQIVSGIYQHYQPGELIGKCVIVVANLKPVKLMGIESQGMILAADAKESLEVPFIHSMPPGTTVK